ncbi:MAG: hypothetical protein ACK46G_14940 [Flavobacteriales bacterium]|jgi:hypothetical protein
MRSLALITLLATLCAHGQWDVPVTVVLNGSTAQQRQVLGLSNPVDSSAAISLAAARDNATTYALAFGSTLIMADLAPSPSAYTVGMVVHLLPQQANGLGAQLDLNGLGPRPLAKQGGLPLDSADLFPGIPARLVYDGNAFILLGNTYLPCRQGYTAVAREFCIEDSSRAPLNFFDAAKACTDLGARLCTFSEWTHACRNIPDFMGTVPTYEWVDSAANNATDAKRLGYGSDGSANPDSSGCAYGSTTVPTNFARFRCCTNR